MGDWKKDWMNKVSINDHEFRMYVLAYLLIFFHLYFIWEINRCIPPRRCIRH